jgi:hypothetical protein
MAIFVSGVLLALVFALIGAGAIVAYGVSGQSAARPNT